MEQNPSDSDTNPFRYCGEYYDIEIGQIYLRARYYDPIIGRFTSLDAYWNTEDIIYGKTEIKSLNDLNKINEELSNAKNGEKLESEDLKKEQKVIQNNIRKIYLDQSKSSEEKREEVSRWNLRKLSEEEEVSIQSEIEEMKVISLGAIVQSGNLYIYCINNPLYYIDPTGCLAVQPTLFGVNVTLTEYETQMLIKTATLGGAGATFVSAVSGAIGGNLAGILVAGVALQAAYFDWLDSLGGNQGLTFFIPWTGVGGVQAYPNS